ncbi:hypothetical protein ACWDA7_38995 [Streptomyces sp. NPDC001156]
MTATGTGIVLRFPAADVLTAAEDATNATAYRTFFDDPPPGPYLVLTAQYGIYLMSNALKPQGTTAVRAFAEGRNEDTDPTGYLPFCSVIDFLPLNAPTEDGNTLFEALRAEAADSKHLVLAFDRDFTRYTASIG